MPNSPTQHTPQASTSSQVDTLTLTDVMTMLRQHVRRFLITTAITGTVLLSAAAMLKPSFTSTGALYVESTSTGGLAALGGLSPLLGQTTSIESGKELLRSNELANHVISTLGMNASLDGPAESVQTLPRYWQWRLGRDMSPYQRGLVVRHIHRQDPLVGKRTYEITFRDEQNFTVRQAGDDHTSDAPVEGQIGQQTTIEGDSFTLLNLRNAPIASGAVFELEIVSPQELYKDFSKALIVEGGGKIPTLRNDLIRIYYTAGSPIVARDVIQIMSDYFIAQKQEWATSSNKAILTFIQQQSEQLRQDLQTSTERLVAFQQSSGLLSMDTQLPADFNRMIEAETRHRMGQLQLARLKQIRQDIQTGKPVDSAAMAYADDSVIRSLVERLSSINLEISGMSARYQPNYPPLEERRQVRQALLNELATLLDNYIQRVESNQTELAKVAEEYRENIRNLPASGRILAEHARSARLHEQLYMFLLQEEQKARMALANTISTIRMVDKPEVAIRETSPKLLIILAVAFIGSVLCGIAMVIYQVARTTWYTSTQEVRQSFAQPVFATIPSRAVRTKRSLPDNLESNLQSPFAEAIRQLRTNILYSAGGKSSQVVTISSSMPSEGKSTITANLAVAMGRSELVPRVILIDADIQKPSIHGIFNLPVTPGLSDYLNGQATIEQIIRQVKIDNNLTIDVITAGPSTPSAVELLETAAMRDLLNYAREHYTITLLDAPPYPVTTSPLILAAQSDRMLSVCRLEVTDRAAFQRHVQELAAVNPRLGIIVNAAETASHGYNGYYGKSSTTRASSKPS